MFSLGSLLWVHRLCLHAAIVPACVRFRFSGSCVSAPVRSTAWFFRRCSFLFPCLSALRGLFVVCRVRSWVFPSLLCRCPFCMRIDLCRLLLEIFSLLLWRLPRLQLLCLFL